MRLRGRNHFESRLDSRHRRPWNIHFLRHVNTAVLDATMWSLSSATQGCYLVYLLVTSEHQWDWQVELLLGSAMSEVKVEDNKIFSFSLSTQQTYSTSCVHWVSKEIFLAISGVQFIVMGRSDNSNRFLCFLVRTLVNFSIYKRFIDGKLIKEACLLMYLRLWIIIRIMNRRGENEGIIGHKQLSRPFCSWYF